MTLEKIAADRDTDNDTVDARTQADLHDHDAGHDAAVYGAVAQVARTLHVPSGDLPSTLDAIVTSAVRTVPSTDDAGLILVTGGRLEPVTTTGPRPTRLDELQREYGNGPCFDAAASQQVVVVADLQRDHRWPDLHQAAAELNVVSMVCVPLRVEARTTGALTLYSAGANVFDSADLAYTTLFATLAALALAEAQRAEQLRTAVASRDLLGQAKGILMERLRLDSDQAFAMLSGVSQTTNTKLTVVAEHLVRTGELIGQGTRPRG